MVDWNTLLWGNPNGYAGAGDVVMQNRRALGDRMGMRGRPMAPAPSGIDQSAIAQAMKAAETLSNIDPLTGNPIKTPNYSQNQYLKNPQSGAAATGNPNALTPAQTGAQTNPFLNNPQSGAAAMGDPNALTPMIPPGTNPGGGVGTSGGNANVPLPPVRPAGLGDGPAQYYTVDPGDGGILKTFMSQNGQLPNLPGMNVMAQGTASPDIGILAKLLRGSF